MVIEAGQGGDAARARTLADLAAGVPFLQFLGIRFAWENDGLVGIMPFHPRLIGNPAVPALHGGATAAFLEVVAVAQLTLPQLEEAQPVVSGEGPGTLPRLPKTIDISIDYLRPGLPRDAFAAARVVRAGRRYASVSVEAWQEDRSRLLAQARGQFLMPRAPE